MKKIIFIAPFVFLLFCDYTGYHHPDHDISFVVTGNAPEILINETLIYKELPDGKDYVLIIQNKDDFVSDNLKIVKSIASVEKLTNDSTIITASIIIDGIISQTKTLSEPYAYISFIYEYQFDLGY